jgi:REP element-mobilizing transposase RayT
MHFSPNNIYHIYNQGNNRQTIFFNRQDYLLFMNLYKKLIHPTSDTISWCLMPNHFHFMIKTDDRCSTIFKQGGIFIDPVTNGFRKLLSSYARISNNQNQRTGSIFRQKTKSKCLNDIIIKPGSIYQIQDYFINCFHYIHQNPFVAKLATRLEDWEFSSFIDYSGLRDGSLCQRELATIHCDYHRESFIEKSYKLVDKKITDHFM